MEPIALLTGGLIASTLYVFAYRRKGRVGATEIGSSVTELTSTASPAEVFDVIAAIGPPHQVDDADKAKLALVLSSRPSIWSYGFLYPVVVRSGDGGGSVVAIGVKSRLIHIGPGMGFAHGRCVKAIEALLTVPPARVT